MGKLSDKYLNPQEQSGNEMNVNWNAGWKGVPAIQRAQGNNKQCRYCGGDCEQVGLWEKQYEMDGDGQMFCKGLAARHICRNCYAKQNLSK
ncbi:hypothetical protein [Bacillus wiedmannii]|uniref:hypothetical protein n=1 Tax=Bacillus wiedmannii TaxID=1890302 RepID=UPI000BFE3B47|nr:hypothetical protein [Bacillus wiedmannii]PHF09291.1 hypothetical protein COF74_10890 [Bacillus wiedmannii]